MNQQFSNLTAAEAESQPFSAGATGLMKALKAREATVGIIGLGYVGLPLGLTSAKAGLNVLGFDISAERVKQINAGESFIKHIASSTIAAAVKSEKLEATADLGRLTEADVIVICVPTPLTKHREPDLSFVVETARSITPRLRANQLVVLESTTYPGTTTEVVRPILEQSGLKSGKDFFLAFSPEREDPGNPNFDTARIPKVVGGDGPHALALALEFYSHIVVKTVPVSSPATAEAVKLTENIFRAVNIALVNELKVIYSAMGIDIWEVIEAAKSKPFGFMAFYPGPGLGGHCIPIDPFYLTWKAREYNITTHFIELAGQINSAMPQHVVDVMASELDRHFQRGLNGSRILLLGIAYKKNVDDMRESPSLTLIELIEARGGKVDYHDPHVPIVPMTREHAALANRKSVPLTPETLSAYDAILISTDHDDVDYGAVVKHSKLVVDTRNACARVRGQAGGIVVKA